MNLLIFLFVSHAVSYLRGEERHCTGKCQQHDANAKMELVMQVKLLEREAGRLLGNIPVKGLKEVSELPCQNGKSGEYECESVDLLSFVPFKDLGSQGEGNDIWGWTSPEGREYAIMGCTDGTSFVDVTKPTEPVVIGFLPSHNQRSSVWRDMKVYKDHVFIISEASGHGMQVFDLRRLSKTYATRLNSSVHVFDADVHYDEFGSCHNIVINEDTGFAYAVGSRTCRGGPHIVDISEPLKPKFVGCYQDDGYTHDAQCVIYNGTQEKFVGREICFCYNEDSLTIIDVEDKDNIVELSNIRYAGVAYSHQGWLTEDNEYLLLDDELDEMQGMNDGYTQTRMWNIKDLTAPFVMDSYYAKQKSVDHNMYVLGDLVYQANYESGLRILNVEKIAEKTLTEVGFFDVRPESTAVAFNGAWSVYPYFESGTLIVSSIERGLFMLKYNP